MEPKYTHDSDCCQFLQTYKGYDLYFCKQNGFPTLIYRYGNEGSQYITTPVDVVMDVMHIKPKGRK